MPFHLAFSRRRGYTQLTMSMRHLCKRLVNAGLRRFGYSAMHQSELYPWQLEKRVRRAGFVASELPAGAREYLRPDNPRLLELEQAYAQFGGGATQAAIWTPGHVKDEEIAYFRGDNAYVWQLRAVNNNPPGWALATYYAMSVDRLGLLSRFGEDGENGEGGEDGLFGVYTFEVANRMISRDLIDSVIELNFLERHLSISAMPKLRILDIGAGYGRLAHRAAVGLDNLEAYLCTDAIAVSTFLCEYYLRFRQVDGKARVAPLHEVETMLAEQPVDLAVNMYSFAECSPEAVEWWLALLKKHRVPRLMIVPNFVDADLNMRMLGDRDMSALFTKHGYKLVLTEPKYQDPIVQRYGLEPARYFLFELA